MLKDIEIRQLTTMEEMKEVQRIEETVWKMSPTPVHLTFTASQNGGIVLGAFLKSKMIGFLYSFAGFKENSPYLCSHMLGILPEYRKGGLGMQMKMKQGEIAKNMGYKMITWTFDPLESLNAYLNIQKLGAVGASYKENHYGEMSDQLNQGLPTDRILIEWNLNEPNEFRHLPFHLEKVLLQTRKDMPYLHEELIEDISHNDGPWFVAIPENFQHIKMNDIELAKKWRHETRRAFKLLFSQGYKAYGLYRDHNTRSSYYLFMK